MADLTFYTNPQSRGRIIRWMLEETEAPYETVVLDYGPAMKSPEYLAINPMGKVPAITHGEVRVTECAAICAYLADAFPEAKLAPELGAPARGEYYRWLFTTAGPLEHAVSNKAFGFEVAADKEMTVGYGNLARLLDVIEARLAEGPYLTGKSFTAADLYLGAQLGWGMMFGTIEKRPAFSEYHERLGERPAAKRAMAKDTEVIAEK